MSFIINPYSFNALHPRLVAWLARGSALGYTLPSAAQQQKLNTFFYALDSAGIITGITSSLLDVAYIFAIDGSSDMATLNIIDPTLYQASKVNSPTFTANQGFNGNGTTSYLDTNWIPSTNGVNYTQNNASGAIYINTNPSVPAAKLDYGCASVAGLQFMQFQSRSTTDTITTAINDGTGGGPSGANANSIGFYHLKRTASNAEAIYKNGASLYTATNISVVRPDRSVFICGRNIGFFGNPSNRQYGMFSAGASLNGLESSFYTAWITYFAYTQYQIVLDRGTALGYTLPSAAQQAKHIQLILDLLTAGIWDLLDVFYVFAQDGDSDFATLNWKAPTSFQATKVNSPTFTANQGFNGNGSTSYINTNFNPSTNSVQATQNSNSFAIGVNSDPAQADVAAFGALTAGTTAIEIFTKSSSLPGKCFARINFNPAGNVNANNATRIGNYIGYRDGANSTKIAKNGADIGSAALASTAFPNLNFFLDARNTLGSPSLLSTELLTHFAWGNFGPLRSSWNTAWNNYFTSL